MTVLVDDRKAVEITIREWDDERVQYGPNWSNDFFEVRDFVDLDDGFEYCRDFDFKEFYRTYGERFV
jgi:hypothetical protein